MTKRYTPHSKTTRRALTDEEAAFKKKRSKFIKRATKEETFRTPASLFKLLVKQFPKLFKGNILDPAAGDGRYIKILIKRGFKGKHVIFDIRKAERKAWKKNGLRLLLGKKNTRVGNFLEQNIKNRFDTAVTNPPFTKSDKFVEAMLNAVKPGGYVIILEKHSFDTGKKRSKWLDTMPLKHIIVIPFRVKFEIDGLTSEEVLAATYNHAFFCFCKGYKGPVIREFLHED